MSCRHVIRPRLGKRPISPTRVTMSRPRRHSATALPPSAWGCSVEWPPLENTSRVPAGIYRPRASTARTVLGCHRVVSCTDRLRIHFDGPAKRAAMRSGMAQIGSREAFLTPHDA